MRKCCVPGCKTNQNKEYVSIFLFPKSSGFRDLWLKKIGRPLMKVTENLGVCIKHFEKQCIVQQDSPNKKRLHIKPGSVPSIFDFCEESQSSEEDTDNSKDMQTIKQSKDSTVVSVSDDSSSSEKDSPKKSKPSPTTDKPFISILKPNDHSAKNSDSKETESDDSDSPSEISNDSNSINLPSPYKNLPSVSVCLKEEDRANAQKELRRSVKRSITSYSTNNTEAIKPQKRKKVEKPAPTVIGREKDCYCWVCHRENTVLYCFDCPRAFHLKCSGEVPNSPNLTDWLCPECSKNMLAETVDTRSSVLADISIDKLCTLLRFSLSKMKHRAVVPFHQPVSLELYPMYNHYVIHPMDFSLLEKNIKEQKYGSTEAFLSDVKWILHNSCVFNGNQHALSTNAKTLVKSCENDMQEIEICPDCFMHSVVRNKYWFSEVCQKPHPLVWAKLKGFPYWPAKVVRIADGNIDARFFGAHDRAWVPIIQCFHLSKEMPTTSKPKKKGNYESALDELNVYVQLFMQKFGKFQYAPPRTTFNPENKLYSYHGIDMDNIDKEENPCDTKTPEKYCLSPSKASNSSSPDKISKEILSLKSTSKDSEEPLGDEQSDSITETKQDSTPQSESKSEVSKTNSIPTDKNAIELALQRIKGYISLDTENEPAPEKEPQPCEDNSTAKELRPLLRNELEKVETSILSDFIKSKPLPCLLDLDDNADKVILDADNKGNDVAKKNDIFALKLSETINSCKAKLGLTETSDLLDKVADCLESESAEDEEEDEDEEDENVEEEEDGEKQDEAAAAGGSATESEEGSSSESEEESETDSSDTDVAEPEDSLSKISKPATETAEIEETEISPGVEKESAPDKVSDEVGEREEEVSVPQNSVVENSKANENREPNPESVVANESQSTTSVPETLNKSPSKTDEPSPMDTDQSAETTALEPDIEKIDDDIYICPPVRAPTPPLICLDEESDPEQEARGERTAPVLEHEAPITAQQYLKSLEASKTLPKNARKSFKRPIRCVSREEEESSGDESVPGERQKVAKRTVHSNASTSGSATANHNAARRDLNDIVVTSGKRDDISVNQFWEEYDQLEVAAEQIVGDYKPESAIPEASLDEKDLEILKLKRKFYACVARIHLERYAHSQEKKEIRHNMNRVVMEMRSSLEAEKRLVVEALVMKFEQEIQNSIKEAKRKQWCANCLREARYACCWNTSYCSVMCQKRHFMEHRRICSQLRQKASEASEAKSVPVSSTIAESNKDGKKLYVLNVVSSKDGTKTNVPECKTAVPISKLMPAKTNLVVTASSPANPVQYLLGSLKSPPTSAQIRPQSEKTGP